MMKEDAIEIVGFHAPIYFDTAIRDTAERVREGLARFEVQLGHGGTTNPLRPTPKRCICIFTLAVWQSRSLIDAPSPGAKYSRPSRNRG
jgi:hypothetical protein